MMTRLDDGEIARRLAQLQGWTRAGDAMRKQYRFGGFKAAMAFVNAVADKAEARDHHPDILVQYDRVTLTLSTHSAGGLTARDFDLAGEIDA
jgi:4a-hydroxytetrahydrobiopterin dehydratase